jgi:hypothetical protein
VSTVQTKGGSHLCVNDPPFVDFVKPAFQFSGRKKEPVLPRDVLVVVWRVAAVTPAPIGFVFVPLADDAPQVSEQDANDAERCVNFKFYNASTLTSESFATLKS